MITRFVSWLAAAGVAMSTLISGTPTEGSYTNVALDKRLLSNVSHAGSQDSIDPIGIYIRACHLNDGSLLAGYAAVVDGTKILRASRSTDDGNTWNQIGEVYRKNAALYEIDNAFPLQLPSGRILYAYRNHDKNSTGAYTYYRITISYSDNGGKDWQYLSTVDQRAATATNNGLWEPFIRIAKDGNLQVYYSAENSAVDQDNLMRYSKDDGLTWSSPITVSGGEPTTSRDGMTGVANIDDKGNLVCVFENTELGTGHFSVDYVLSHDDGYTWAASSRGRLYTAANNKNAGAPGVVNVGGTLVASFMTNEGDSSPQLDGGQMKVVTCTDGVGKAWNNDTAYVTGGDGSHWPGMLTMDDTHFLALYSQNGVGAVSQLYMLN